MKKILTLLTGIVLLVAFLVTCGGRDGNDQKDPQQVKIYLKAVELDGEMHLEMRDSNNPGNTVIDDLITIVHPGDHVMWKKDNPGSGIQHIDQIRFKKPVRGQGLIFSPGPVPGDSTYIIPPNAEPGQVKYVIIFTDTEGNIWPIDPHLIIPPEN